MKVYEKPKLVMMSISGNDLLCSCEVDSEGTNADPGYTDLINSIISAGYKPFDSGDTNCTLEVTQYCKYTSARIIINS